MINISPSLSPVCVDPPPQYVSNSSVPSDICKMLTSTLFLFWFSARAWKKICLHVLLLLFL